MRKSSRTTRMASVILLIALVSAIFAVPSSWAIKQGLPDNQFFNWLKSEDIQLGLDLQGGTQLKYRIDLSEVQMGDREQVVEGMIGVIRNRVDGLGVAEPIIQSSKIGESHFIIVELPGIDNIEEAIQIVGKTVQLEFKEPKTEYSEAELTDINAFNDAQRERTREALEKIQSGENIDSIAEQYSEGMGLYNLGVQDFQPENGLPEVFKEPVAGLTDGDLYNDIVETDEGLYIVKLIESKTEEVTTTDEEGNEVASEERQVKLQVIRLNKKATVPDGGYVETGLTGKQFKHASVTYDQNINYRVSIQFDEEGKDLFAQITERNVGQPVAIFLDDFPISEPVVQEPITDGEAVITGQFTQKEANDLAMNLNTGALPAPIVLIGQSNVGATLGQNALSQGIMAGVIGLIILGLFMIAYYRLPGIVAVLALGVYAMIIIALFKILGVTLTLAGIAGVILSIGMAVDANILIFERFKEELKSGKTIKNSIEIGFKRAWTSIRDSNISSLITCFILFMFGTGIIKGFAVTLSIGIIVSMFTAINVTRALLLSFTTATLTKSSTIWGVKPADVGTFESFDEVSRAEKRRKKKRRN